MYRSSRSSCLIQQYHVFLAFQCKGFFLFGFGVCLFFCQCSDNKAQLQTLNSTPFTFVSFTQSSADGHISIKPLLFCRATHKQACLKREKKKCIQVSKCIIVLKCIIVSKWQAHLDTIILTGELKPMNGFVSKSAL